MAETDSAHGTPAVETSEPGRAGRLGLAGVFALALALRLGLLAALHGSPFTDALVLDSQLYWEMAQRIVAGQAASATAFFVDPLYAYFLAAVHLLGGGSTLWVRLLQVLLGSASCVLAARLARELGADRRVEIITGLGTAAYPVLIYYDLQLLKTTLEIFLCLAGVTLAARAQRTRSSSTRLLAGGVLGLAALTHGAQILLIPALAAWIFLAARPVARRDAARGAGLLLLGAALVILPVTVRNYLASGQFVLTTYNAGMNLWEGNNPEADGAYRRPSFLQGDPLLEEADSRREAERRSGRTLGPAEISAFWLGETRRFVAAQPGAALRLLGRKALLFWNHHEVDDNVSFYFTRQFVPFLALPFPGFRIWGAIGLAGLLWSVPAWRRLGPAQIATSMVMAGGVAFHVIDRYRLPAVPFLILLGAALVCDAWDAARARNHRRLAQAAALILGAACVVNLPNFYRAEETYSRPYYSLGKYYFEHGDDARAIEACGRSLAIDNEYPPPHQVLAKALLRSGDPGRALLHFREALRLLPADSEAYYGEGIALLRMGDLAEAEASFRRALAREPDGAASYWLGETALAAGDGAAAADWFRAALTHGRPPQALLGLVRASLLQGDLPAARTAYAELPRELRNADLDRRLAAEGP